MEQMYSCPNCGEIVYYGEPVCRNCGIELDWTAVEVSPPEEEYQYQDYGQDQQWDQQQWDQQQSTPPPEDYQQTDYGQYYVPPPPGKRARSGKTGKPPAQKKSFGDNIAALQKRKKLIRIALISVVCVIIAAAAIAFGLGFNPFVSSDNGQPDTTTPTSENNSPGTTVSGPIEIVRFVIDPPVIPDGETSTLFWEVTGADEVTINQGIGQIGPSGQQVVSPSATTTYTLIASNSSGSETASATISVNIGAPKVIFTANPSTIAIGGTSTLTWEVTGANTIKLGHDTVAASGTREVTDMTSTTTFTLTATNSAGVTEAKATVSIGASGKPVITSFGANPDFLNTGESTTLEWYVTNADSVSINHDIGTVATYGSKTVTPSSTITYTMTAANSAGSTTLAVTVTISSDGKPVIDFYPKPINITTGQTSTLHWVVAGAETMFIDQNIGTISASGTREVSPTVTTIYTLTATNENGTTFATAEVKFSTVNLPVINDFDVTPGSMSMGQSATLSWNVSNADSITIDNGVGTVQPSGTKTVSPIGTTIYTITAINSSGTITATITLHVN